MNKLAIIIAAQQSADELKQNFEANARELLNMAAGFIFGILGLTFTIWGIYIGLKWMTAKKAEQYQEAKELLKRFFVGMALIFIIAAIAGIVFGVMQEKFITK